MYLTLITLNALRGLKVGKNYSKMSKRDFTHKSSFPDLYKKQYLPEKIDYNEVIINVLELPRITVWWDNISFFFMQLINRGSIEKIQPLVSEFYLNNMVNNLHITKVFSNCGLCNFNFVPQCFTLEGFFFNGVMLLFSNRIFQVFLLCTVVYLMRILSSILCSNVNSVFLSSICQKIKNSNDKNVSFIKYHVISFAWFLNTSIKIAGLSSWLDEYFYKNSYRKLYDSILFYIYNNIKHLITRFYLNFSFSFNKYKFIYIKASLHVIYNLNLILFSGANLNIMYATLTVVYIGLGWLLDYLSYMWKLLDSGFKFRYILTMSFWLKQFLYAVIYILWLCMGVFTTNGVYLSILSRVTSSNVFNIAIAVLGSIFSWIASNLWFFYGNPTSREGLNIFRIIIDDYIIPLLLRDRTTHNNIGHLFRTVFQRLFAPSIFNFYSSFRRSLIEWIAFLGMVFSTYGTWNLYTLNVFYSISIIQNLLIWTVPSFMLGYTLIYIEDLRPRFSNYYYGLVYILFWTSICFFTNSILLGYIDINNAASALFYFIPINFLLASIYPLPLYRYNLNASNRGRLLHVFCFILLTSITLLSAGTIWSIISM